MKKRILITVFITVGLGLAISRGWNELWQVWLDHQNWDLLWEIMHWSIGRIAWGEAAPKWVYVNEGTMIFVGIIIYMVQWAFQRRPSGT